MSGGEILSDPADDVIAPPACLLLVEEPQCGGSQRSGGVWTNLSSFALLNLYK